MKINYYPDTDSLYIDLSEQPSAESREVSEGIVLDYDAEGCLVGIDIDNASKRLGSKRSLSKRFQQASRYSQRRDQMISQPRHPPDPQPRGVNSVVLSECSLAGCLRSGDACR